MVTRSQLAEASFPWYPVGGRKRVAFPPACCRFSTSRDDVEVKGIRKYVPVISRDLVFALSQFREFLQQATFPPARRMPGGKEASVIREGCETQDVMLRNNWLFTA